MSLSSSILIISASQGIRWHCAIGLLDENYPVIIRYRTEKKGLKQLQVLVAHTLYADFRYEAVTLDFIQRLEVFTLGLQAINHNASERPHDPSDQERAFFTRLFNIHMLAPYLINLHCAELLRQSHPADIIHNTDNVVRKGVSSHIVYRANKTGSENFTLSFGSLQAPHIKVNGIAPALIMFNPTDSEEYRGETMAKSALENEPGPKVVYRSIRYLLDNPCLTGTTLTLNGGRHSM